MVALLTLTLLSTSDFSTCSLFKTSEPEVGIDSKTLLVLYCKKIPKDKGTECGSVAFNNNEYLCLKEI